MRSKITIAGLMVLGACLIGWAALALAQQSPMLPEPPMKVAMPDVHTTGAPTPLPVSGIPTLPTPAALPNTALPTSIPLVDPKPAPMPMDPVGPMPMDPPIQAIGGYSNSEEQPPTTVTVNNPVGRQEPAVTLEWIGSPTAKVGQAADYSLLVRNVGNTPVQQVLVRVRMPKDLTVSATEPKCVTEKDVLVWDQIGTLLAKQEKCLQMKLQAVSKGDMMPQAWVTFTGSSVMRISVREPKLVLKTSVNDKVLVGDTANFSLTVTNPGDGSADRVKIHAVLSEGLEHAKGNAVDFEIGNLAAGETRSVQLLCISKAGGLQTCDATAEAEGGLTSKDHVKLNVIMPRLDLVLMGPGLRYLDRKALYTLRVTNPGDAPATNVTVGDMVPDGFKVLAASDGGRHDFSTRTVSWFLGEIAPGQTREVKFEVQAINVGEHKHKAMASGARNLRAEAELMTRIEGLSALLLEMVDTEDPIEVGGDTAYEVRVTNTGTKTETDIRLIATVPDKMEFKDAKGPVRYRTEGKTIVFEPLEKLAPRADAILRINVKAVEAGTVRFKIQMTSTNLQEPVIKMEATRIYSDAPEGKSSASTPVQPQHPIAPMPPG